MKDEALHASCTDEEDYGQCVCENDPDVCENGTSRDAECPADKIGDGAQQCVNGQWDEVTGCVDPPDCVGTEEKTIACGYNDNGTIDYICDDEKWTVKDHDLAAACNNDPDDIACLCVNDPDDCENETTRAADCPSHLIGDGWQTCTDGAWSDVEGCVVPPDCDGDETSSTTCGYMGSGVWDVTCVDGFWEPNSSCIQHASRMLPMYNGIMLAPADPEAAELLAFGDNSAGVLGVDMTPEELDFSKSPTASRLRVSAADRTLSVNKTKPHTNFSAMSSHACAILPTSTGGSRAWCWGKNDKGQTGQPTTTNAVHKPTAVTPVAALSKPLTIGVGLSHTCALDQGTQGVGVTCWGDNTRSQLGRATTSGEQLHVPVRVPNTSGATLLAVGGEHNCALIDNEVRCWGRNNTAQAGPDYGTNAVIETPTKYEALSTFPASISRPDNVKNDIGCRRPITPVNSEIIGLYAGVAASGYTLALWATQWTYFKREPDPAGGKLRCIPRSSGPYLYLVGIGLNNQNSNTLNILNDTNSRVETEPVLIHEMQVPVRGTFRYIVHTGLHNLCIETSTDVTCRGQNGESILSDSNTLSSVDTLTELPQSLNPDGKLITDVALGTAHLCIRLSDKTIRCRGRNNKGQLGGGENGPYRSSGVTVVNEEE